MQRTRISPLVMFLAVLFFTACAGGSPSPNLQKPAAQKPDVQLPTVQRPVVQKPDPQKPESTVQKPDQPPARGAAQITPAGINLQRTSVPQLVQVTTASTPPVLTPRFQQPGVTPTRRGTPGLNRPTPQGTLATVTRQATVTKVKSVSGYDAQQMITSFASQYLGLGVHVTAATGTHGEVNLPSAAQAEMNEAISLAGQIGGGVITANGSQGGAQVAVGEGSVSGDLNADISGASEGAYSLLVRSAPPASAQAALSLLRSTFLALASINLQQQSASSDGYVFYATTTHQGVDWKTKKVTTVAEAVLAGTSGQGKSTTVWVVIGNGTFATSVRP